MGYLRYGAKNGIKRSFVMMALFAVAMSMVEAHADISIAQVIPLTGPIGVEGREYALGAHLAADALNAKEGVKGQKLLLRTEDDHYNPDRTIAFIRELAGTDTLAMVLPLGSPQMSKVLQGRVLEEVKMPMVGVVPGAEPLRILNPYVFHVRAGDSDQYRKLIQHALTIGQKNIAVVYADIPFGKAGLAKIESLLKAASLEPKLRLPVPISEKPDFKKEFSQIKAAAPNLIVLVLPAQLAGEFLRDYREQELKVPISTVSYGNPEVLCGVASPERARGVTVAQVFPNVRNTTIPIVREFQDDFRKFGPKDRQPNVLHLEGYITLRVLTEAINRIPGAPSREGLIKALNSMQKASIGGFEIDFSPGKHTGSNYVDLGVISTDCKLIF